MVINGAAKEIGRAAVIAVTRARGMEVAGAVDSHFVGEDIGKVSVSFSPFEPQLYDLPCVQPLILSFLGQSSFVTWKSLLKYQ